MLRLHKLVIIGGLFATTCAWADSFTLSPGSPTLPGVPALPADILIDTPGAAPAAGPPPPTIGVPFGALGLAAGDVVDAISNGADPVNFPGHLHYFSVTYPSVGVPGTGVFTESSIADTPPGATPGHASDIFLAGSLIPVGTNILAPAGFGWTLGTTTGDEANTNLINALPDNVNAYDLSTLVPGAPIYFSLAAGSASLAGLGATPDDILVVGGAFGAVPVLWADGVLDLGLPVGTDLDALALINPIGAPTLAILAGAAPGTRLVEYSVTSGTAGLLPPLAPVASGADIFGYIAGVAGPVRVHTAGDFGLLTTDDVDALDVDQQTIPEPTTSALFVLGGLMIACRARRSPLTCSRNTKPVLTSTPYGIRSGVGRRHA